MAIDENNRVAIALCEDFLKVHRRLHRKKGVNNSGKQPRRKQPPVHFWRAPEQTKSNDNADVLKVFRS